MPEKINAIQSLQAQHYSEYKDDMRAIKRALAIRLNNEYTTNRPMRLSENQN